MCWVRTTAAPTESESVAPRTGSGRYVLVGPATCELSSKFSNEPLSQPCNPPAPRTPCAILINSIGLLIVVEKHIATNFRKSRVITNSE
jgi:hypothetical protein